MGSGIAHVFAKSGFSVSLCDVEQRFLDRAIAAICTNLGREVSKGKLAESEVKSALNRITPTINIQTQTNTQQTKKTTPKQKKQKTKDNNTHNHILPESAILATNTSSI